MGKKRSYGGAFLQSISPSDVGGNAGLKGTGSWNVGQFNGAVSNGSPGTAALMAGGGRSRSRSRTRRGRTRRGRTRSRR